MLQQKGGDPMKDEQLKKFHSLYQELYQTLLQIAFFYLQSRSLAEEAVQEAFRVAAEKIDDLLSSPNPSGWLALATRNTAKNLLRQERAYQRLLMKAAALPEENYFEIDDFLSLETMRENLTNTEEYQLLKLFVYEGLSTPEVAERLGITVNACRIRKSRAIKTLREKILEENEKELFLMK